MKRLLKLTALLLFAQLSQLQAQTSVSSDQPAGRKKWGLTASFNPGVNFDNGGIALGADLRAERRLTDLLGLTFSAGFTSIAGDNIISIGEENIIPVKLGLKIYADKKYYLAGDVGIAIDINGNSNTAWSVTGARQINSRFDLGLKYDDYFHSNVLSVRLGYRIF